MPRMGLDVDGRGLDIRGGIGQPFCFLWDYQMHCSLRRNFGNKMVAPAFSRLSGLGSASLVPRSALPGDGR